MTLSPDDGCTENRLWVLSTGQENPPAGTRGTWVRGGGSADGWSERRGEEWWILGII